MLESSWSHMQVDLHDRQLWQTRIELVNAIFIYLDILHDRDCRRSAIGMLSPVESEARHEPTTVA
jgi:hypothetical protein